jgi:WD40 repeat protein
MIHEVALSPNGQFAAVLISQAEPKPREKDHFEDKWKYTDRRLQIVDLETGKVQQTIADEKATIKSLTFSPDGNQFAWVMENSIWHLQIPGGEKKLLAKSLSSWIGQLTFTQKNQLAALFGDDSIRAWELSTSKPLEPPPIRRHHFETAKSSRVVATIHKNTVRLLDRDSGKPLHSFAGHRLTPVVRFAIHSKETLLSRDGDKAHWWDTRSWKIKQTQALPGDDSHYWSRWGNPEMDESISLEKQLYVKENKERLELRDLRATDLFVLWKRTRRVGPISRPPEIAWSLTKTRSFVSNKSARG